MNQRPSGEGQSLAGRLYDSYGASLYRYAVMLLMDPSAAEDAVQQVFAALVKRGDSPRLDNEAHYLRRAIRNECYSFRRRRKLALFGSDSAFLEQVEEAASEVSPEERLTLERAIRNLPMEQRDVLHLHVFEGLTLREVADGSGESINTIASRYRYAIGKLRDAFEK